MRSKMPVGRGLSDTQVQSSKGREASTVVSQSEGSLPASARRGHLTGGKDEIGHGLKNTQTRNSSTVVNSGTGSK